MRKLYCLIVVSFFGLNLFAQTRDTVFKDTAKRVIVIDAKEITKHDKALYIVDGIIFKGNIKRINPNNILSVAVLKPPGSVNIYGAQGVNGAVLITTRAAEMERNALKRRDTVYPDTSGSNRSDKPLILIDGVVYKGDVKNLDPNNISEINVVRNGNYIKTYGEASKNGMIFITTKGHQNSYALVKSDSVYRSTLPDSAMYVIDGRISDRKLEGVKPEEILSIHVLKDEKTLEMFNGARHGVVVVTTKAGAMRKYKNRLSALSAQYKEYLGSHEGDDVDLHYTINGNPCIKDAAGLEKLDALSQDKIAEVKISKKGVITTVAITTKK